MIYEIRTLCKRFGDAKTWLVSFETNAITAQSPLKIESCLHYPASAYEPPRDVNHESIDKGKNMACRWGGGHAARAPIYGVYGQSWKGL